MLPVFTTAQVKDGIDTGDYMLDLSEYMKKKDAATKTDLQSLTNVVAGKLDANPQHKHDIADVKDLREELDSKYDTSKKYSYNVILSDVEKIPYLEKPRVSELDISANRDIDGYRFYVDDKSGDLMIVLNEVLIASYSIAAGKWSFETDTSSIDAVLDNHGEALNAVCNATLKNITDIQTCAAGIAQNSAEIAENGTKITNVEDIINEYIAKTDAVLKNHYDALLLLCEKHGMVDGDGDAGNNISPQ